MAEGPSQYVAADMDKEDKKHSSNDLSEDFVEYGKHYSHEHPLKLMSRCEDDIKEYDDDEAYKSLCRICGVPILSSPSYTCSIGCKFIIHQPCALKLPTKFIHPTHRSLRDGEHTLCIKQSSTNFIYECEDCTFSLHPLVAFPQVEIKVKHKSHASHSLVAFCKRVSCECDACGREEKGFFFHCGECNFWIHQDCTILPSALKLIFRRGSLYNLSRYPFILAYSLPFHHVGGLCVICDETLLVRHSGVYFSPESSAFAHIACGSMDKSASKVKLELIQLPDDEWDTTFPILAIRKPFGDGDVEFTINRYHNCDDHDYNSSTNRELSQNLYCDLCTRPINISSSSSSLYKCHNCHFVAHKLCADILPLLKLLIPIGEGFFCRGKFCQDLSAKFFNSIFYCAICRRPCNRNCHYFEDLGLYPSLFMDLECMAAPSIITHTSHAQHLLIRTHLLSGSPPLTCCPDKTSIYDVYRCIFCDYSIHVSCAMLPKRIVCHDYDEHPLHLAFTSTANPSNFCEVCEEEIDLHYWLYQCQECDKLFHINCIPSVGYLSKVKFGGTISLPNSHSHPLALTRMLTVPSQRCGHCKQIIQGMKDQMAFFCSHCHFWLHFSCARDANVNATR